MRYCEQTFAKKHPVRALIAAIVVTTFVTIAAITASYSGGGSGIPYVFSQEYVPPQQSDSIRNEASVSGGQAIQDDVQGQVMVYKKGQTVDIDSKITNTGRAAFAFNTLDEGYIVYDSNGVEVYSIGKTYYLRDQEILEPGKSLVFPHKWPQLIRPGGNYSLPVEAAPAGNYTIRTMILEPVVIADEKVIVIKEESTQ